PQVGHRFRRPGGSHSWSWSLVTRPVPMNSVTAAPMSPAFPAAPAAVRTPAGDNKVEKQFSPLVQQFLSYLKLEKHFSEYTVKSYGADLIQFGQYLSGEIGQHNSDHSGNGSGNGSVAPAPASKVSPEELDKRQLGCEPLTI